MADNPSDPLVNKDRMRLVADEQSVGGHFDGEGERERSVGIDRLVVVDVFKRRVGPDAGTYFMRVSLRSMVYSRYISRYEIDIDKHNSESEFLFMVLIGGGAVAEADNENRGANWDTDFVAKQARDAAKELLHNFNAQ